MSVLGYFFHEFLNLYGYCIIFYVLLNILISFAIINQSNNLVNINHEFFV